MINGDELRDLTNAAKERHAKKEQNRREAELNKKKKSARRFAVSFKRDLDEKMEEAAKRGSNYVAVIRGEEDRDKVSLMKNELRSYCEKRKLRLETEEEKPVGSDPGIPCTIYHLYIRW